MRMHVRVQGRVQGVGFRYFASHAANQRALSGWVRNLPDGDVECEVQGPDGEIEKFLEELRAGQGWTRVDRLESEKIPEKSNEKGFEIRS